VNEYSFTSDIKIIPLEHFDFILGMDWLEQFSPMKVHWNLKWMAIPYQGYTALLQGTLQPVPDAVLVQERPISMDTQAPNGTEELPPAVAALIEEFATVFAPIEGMPPPRSRDHSIPLVAGAKPVFIRPYRYPPALKDEIEKQIQEMLDKGKIRPSNSPFSSSMILVRKCNTQNFNYGF
jgi:hypothetical protein